MASIATVPNRYTRIQPLRFDIPVTSFPSSEILDERQQFTTNEINEDLDPSAQLMKSRSWIVTLHPESVIENVLAEFRRLGVTVTPIVGEDRQYQIVLPLQAQVTMTPKEYFMVLVSPITTSSVPKFVEIIKVLPIWRSFKNTEKVQEPIEPRILAGQNVPSTPLWKMTFDTSYLSSTQISRETLIQSLKAVNITVFNPRYPTGFIVTFPGLNEDGEESPEAFALRMVSMNRSLFTPRNLTLMEIDNVVNVLPKVESAIQEIGESIRRSIQNRLREVLINEKVAPAALPLIVSDILRCFVKGRIAPGTMVGVNLADALGQPITQMVLNTFHQAGSVKSVSTGVEAVREILNVTKVRKHENCQIYFKKIPMTFEEIYEKRIPYVEMSIGRLLKSTETETYRTLSMSDQGTWWHNVYQASTGRYFRQEAQMDISQVGWILRLHVNLNTLYASNLTLNDIVESLDIEYRDKSIFIIPSPLQVGIINIIPIPKRIRQPLRDLQKALDKRSSLISPIFDTFVFLQNIVLPTLRVIIIKGIPGVQNLFPDKAPVLSGIIEEYPRFTSNDLRQMESNPEVKLEDLSVAQRIWQLGLNRVAMIENRISVEAIEHLLKTVGCQMVNRHLSDGTIIDMVQGSITSSNGFPVLLEIIMPNLIEELEKRPSVAAKLKADSGEKTPSDPTVSIINVNMKPSEWVKLNISAEESARKTRQDAIRSDKNMGLHVEPLSEVEKASLIRYAEVEGDNLVELMSMPSVNSKLCTSNNVFMMYKIFGIEAARTIGQTPCKRPLFNRR